MKKVDKHTIVGIAGGAAILLLGISWGGSLKIFWNFSSILVTLGGSFFALLVIFSYREIIDSSKIFMKAIKESAIDRKVVIVRFIELSKLARRRGLLSIEKEIWDIEDEYLKKGLQMLVDGVEPEDIQEILQLEIDEMSRRHCNGANLFKVWGKYAQAFGMIATFIGLIQMLANLADPSSLTLSMAKALTGAFYGIILDYILFSPISANLTLKSNEEIAVREMMIEGILAIQSGVNHTVIEEKLMTFLSPKDKLEYISFNFSGKEGGYENE